jgi:hypothetical protein
MQCKSATFDLPQLHAVAALERLISTQKVINPHEAASFSQIVP